MTDNYSTTIYGSEFNRVEYTLPDDSSGTTFYYNPTSEDSSGSIDPSFSLNKKELGISDATNVAYSDNIIFIAVDNTIKVYQYSNNNWVHIQDISPRDSTETNFGKYISFSYNNQNVSVVSEDSTSVYKNDYAIQKYLPTSMVDNESTFQDNTDNTVMYSNYNTLATVQEDIGEIEDLSLNFEKTNSQQDNFIGNVTFNNLSSFKIWVSDDDTPITRCQYLGIDKTANGGINLYYINHNGPVTIALNLESGTTYTAPTFSYYSYIALNNYVMESVYLLYDSVDQNIVYYDTANNEIVGDTTWDEFSSAIQFLPYPDNTVWLDYFEHTPNYENYQQIGDWKAYPAINDVNTNGTNQETLIGNVIFVGETNVSHVVAQVINNIELVNSTNSNYRLSYEKPDVFVVIEPSDTNSDSKVYIRQYSYSNNTGSAGDDLVKEEVNFSTSPGRINDICITNDGSYVFLIAENGIFYRPKGNLAVNFTYIENSNNINWTGIALSYSTTDPLYVTAVSEDGIYKVSTTSIEKVSSLTDWTTVSVSKDGKYQVAASSSEGLYYSEDFGNSWNLKDSTKTNFKKIQILANGKIIYYTNKTITQSNLNTIIFENPFDTSKEHSITSPNSSYTFKYNFATDKIGTGTDNQYYLLYTQENNENNENNNQVISSFATETISDTVILDKMEYEDYAVFQLTKEGNLEYRPAKIYEPPQPYIYAQYNSETGYYDPIPLDYRPAPPQISSNSGDMGVDKVALNNLGNLILLTKDNQWVLTGQEIAFVGATSSSLSGDGQEVAISDSSAIKKYNYSDGNWIEDTSAEKTGTYGVLSNDGSSLYYINNNNIYKDNDLLFSSGDQDILFKQLLINKDSYSNDVDTVRLLVLQEFNNNDGLINSGIYIYRKNNHDLWDSSGFDRDGAGNASISFDETGYIAGLRFLETETTYKTFILIDGDSFSTIFESSNDGPNSHFSLSSTGQNMILNTTSVETLQLSSNVLTLVYTPPIDDTDGINITVPYLQNRTYSSLPLTVNADTLVKNLEKTIDEDNTLTINLNDEIRWESNEELEYNIQTQPTIGTVQIESDGETLVYTPNANIFDTSQGDLIVVRANIDGDSNNYFDSYIRIYINSVFDKTTGSVSIGTTNPYPENTLSASVTLIDGDIDTNNLIVSYQWYYVDSSNDTVYDSSTWTVIEGATDSSYTIPGENDQVGKNIAVRVTAEDTSDSLIPEIFTSNIVQVINFVSSTNISLEVNKGETFTYNLDSLEVESTYPVTFSVSSYESNDGAVVIDSNGDVIFTPISTQFNQTTIFVINASIDTSITTFVSSITFTLEYNNADIVKTGSTYQGLPFIYNLDSLDLIDVTDYTIISEPTSNSVSFEGVIDDSNNPKRVIYTPGTFTESSQNVTIILESVKGSSGDPVDTIKFTVTVYQQPTISGTVEYGHTVSVDTTDVSTTTYPTISYTNYIWEFTNEEDFSTFTEFHGESFEIASDLNAEFIRYKVTVTNDYETNQVILYSEEKHIISTYNSLDQQVDDNLLTSITLPNFYYNKLVTYSNPITNDSNTIIIKNLIQNWNLSSTITTNQSLIDAAQDAFIVSDGTNITVYKNNNGTWETVGNFTDTFTNITSVSVVSDSFIYLNTSDTFYSYKYSNVAAYLYPNGTSTSEFFKQIGNVDIDKFTIVSLEDTLKSFSLMDLTSYDNVNDSTQVFDSVFNDLLSFHIFVSNEDQRLTHLRAVSLDKTGDDSLVFQFANNNGTNNGPNKKFEYTGSQYKTGTTYTTPTQGKFVYVAYTKYLVENNNNFNNLTYEHQTDYSTGQTIDGNNITHVISSLSKDSTIYPYVYVATGGGFYRSESESQRGPYEQIGGITNVTGLAITNDGQYVYVATTSGLYYSNDFGGTFNTVGDSSSSWLGVAVGYNHTESSSEPYASAITPSGEIYTNSDWNNPVETNFTGLKSITSSADGQYQIIASTSGLYYSQDFGSTWELRNNTNTDYDNILMCADGQVFAYNSTEIDESNINAMIPVNSSYSDTLVSDYSFNFIRNSTDGTTVNVQNNNGNTFATFYDSSQEKLQAFFQLSVSGNLEFYDSYGKTSPTLQSYTSNMGVTKLQLDSDGNLLLVADSESWMKITEVGAFTVYNNDSSFGNVTDSASTLLAKNAIVYTESDSEGKVMFLYENFSFNNSSIKNENRTVYNYLPAGTSLSGVSNLNIGDNIFCYLYEDNGSNRLRIYKFTSTTRSLFSTEEYEVVEGSRINSLYINNGDYSQVKLKNNLIAMLTSDNDYIHFLEYRPDAGDIKMYLQGSIDLGSDNTDASISLDNIAFIITVNYTNSNTNHQKIYSYNPASSEWEVTSSSSLNNTVLGGENLFDLDNSSIKIYELESQLQVETEGAGEAYVSFNVNSNNDTVERFINITSGSSLLQGTTLTVDEDSIGNTFNLNDYKVNESQNLIYEIDEIPDYGSASINENILTYSTQEDNYYGETKIKIKATVDGDSSSVDYTTFIINIVNVADTTTGSVSVSGILAENQKLTATATLENVDELGTISAYEWYFSTDDINWELDTNLTSHEITLTSDDVGQYVKVKVVIDEAHGGTTEIESSSSSKVIISGIPTISGNVYIGQVVTADASFNFFSGNEDVTISEYSWTINDEDIKPILHHINYWGECGTDKAYRDDESVPAENYVVGSSLATWGCENYNTNLQHVLVQELVPNANTKNHPPTDVTNGSYVVESPEINGSSYTIGSAFYGDELKVTVTVNNVEYQSTGYKINDETFFDLGIESNDTVETTTTITLPNFYPTDTTYFTTYSNFAASDTNFITTLEPVNSFVQEEDYGALSDVTSSNASKNLQYIIKNSSDDTINVYNLSTSGVSQIGGGIPKDELEVKSFFVVHHRSDDNFENLFHYDYNRDHDSRINDEGQELYDYLRENPDGYITIPKFGGNTLYTYTAAPYSTSTDLYQTTLRDLDGNKPEPPKAWATTVYVFESIDSIRSFTSFGDKVYINQDGTRIALTGSFPPNEQTEGWLTQNFYFYYQGGASGNFEIWRNGYFSNYSIDDFADDLLVQKTMDTQNNTYSSGSFDLSSGVTNQSPIIIGKYLTNLYLQITGSFYVSLNGDYQFRFDTGYANMQFYLNERVYRMNSSVDDDNGDQNGIDKWTGTPVDTEAYTPLIELSNLTRYNFKIEYMVVDNGSDLNTIRFDQPNIFIIPEGGSYAGKISTSSQGWSSNNSAYIQVLGKDQKYLYRWYTISDSDRYKQTIEQLMSYGIEAVTEDTELVTWDPFKDIPGTTIGENYYLQIIGSFTSNITTNYQFSFTTDDGIRMGVSTDVDGLGGINLLTFPDNGTYEAWGGHGATTFTSNSRQLTAGVTYYFMIEFIQGTGASSFLDPKIIQNGTSYNWNDTIPDFTINTFDGYNYNWYKLNPTTNTYIYDYNQDNDNWERKHIIEGDAQPNKDLTTFVHKGFNVDSEFKPAIITTNLTNIENPITTTTTIENVAGVNTISWDGTTVIVETSNYEIIWVTNLDESEYGRTNGYFFDEVNVNFIKYSSADLSTSTTISTTLTENTNAIVINSNTIAFEIDSTIDSTIYILDLNNTSSISNFSGKAPISISDDEGTVVFQNTDNTVVKYIRYNGSSWEEYASYDQAVQNNIINESGETLLLLDGTNATTYNLEQKLEITYQGEQGDANIDFDIFNGVSYDRFISVENSVLIEDEVISVNEDNSITYNLNNMRIDDNKTLTYSIIGYDSSDGDGEIDENGTNLTYIPNENNTNTNVFTIQATYVDNNNNTITQTATLTINVNPIAEPTTGSVSITGTPLPNQTLTAEVSVSDPDVSNSSLIIAYQWQMSDDSNWDSSDSNVGTESTFTLPDTNDNAGKYIRVVITVTDPTDSSNPTDFISNTVQIEELQLVYTNEILGTITGDGSFEVDLSDSNIFNTGYTLTFVIESEQNGSVNIDTGILTFTPEHDFPESTDSGLASFILEVRTDTNETTITQSIIYYITVSNLITDGTWTVQEDDSSRVFNLNDLNQTSSELTYSISGAPSVYSTFEFVGTELIYEPEPNYYGTDSVTVTATMGTSSQTATLTIVTESVNDTPVFLSTNPGNQEIEPGVLFKYNIEIQDIETSDIPILTISGEPGWLTLSGTNLDGAMTTKNDSGYFTATLSGTPEEQEDFGIFNITLLVTDGSDSTLFNTQSFTIEVGGLVQDQTVVVNEDDPTQIDLNIMRVDSSLDLVYEIVTYDTNVGSAEITDSSSDILVYTTASHDTNGNQITIRATNVADSSQTATAILTINVIPIADPTTGSVSIDGTPLPNQTLTAVVSVSDPDVSNSSLIIAYQWQMSDDSNWDSSDSNVGTESTFTLPDTNDNAGKYIRVVITVTDPTDSSNPTDFTSNTVQIEELQLVYTNEILGTTTEDFGFVVNLSDSNIFNTGYTLTFTTKSEQNGSVNIDNNNNTLTFTPDSNFPESADSGLASFILEVGTDTNETTITQSIIYYITVTQDNDEPTGTVSVSGTPLPNQTLTADTSAITDVESDSLVFTYQWQMSPDNTNWDSDVSNSSTYTLPDTNDNAGKYIRVIVTAYENDTNDSNPTDFTSNEVQIQTLNLVNDTSVSVNINEDTTFTQDLNGYVQDSSEYPVSFTIKSSDTNFGDATIDTNNDLIFVPIANVNGDTTIVVTASTDSTLTSITQDITFNLTINEVHDDAVGEISFTGFYNVGGTLTVNKNITDVDGTLNSSNYSYQWYTLSDSSSLTYDTATWTEIIGGTNSTLDLDSSYSGAIIGVKVTTNVGGTTEFSYSPGIYVGNGVVELFNSNEGNNQLTEGCTTTVNTSGFIYFEGDTNGGNSQLELEDSSTDTSDTERFWYRWYFTKDSSAEIEEIPQDYQSIQSISSVDDTGSVWKLFNQGNYYNKNYFEIPDTQIMVNGWLKVSVEYDNQTFYSNSYYIENVDDPIQVSELSITGFYNVGGTLTINKNITDDDGLDTNTFEYQWYTILDSSSSSTYDSATWTPINNATEETLTLDDSNLSGVIIGFRITITDLQGTVNYVSYSPGIETGSGEIFLYTDTSNPDVPATEVYEGKDVTINSNGLVYIENGNVQEDLTHSGNPVDSSNAFKYEWYFNTDSNNKDTPIDSSNGWERYKYNTDNKDTVEIDNSQQIVGWFFAAIIKYAGEIYSTPALQAENVDDPLTNKSITISGFYEVNKDITAKITFQEVDTIEKYEVTWYRVNNDPPTQVQTEVVDDSSLNKDVDTVSTYTIQMSDVEHSLKVVVTVTDTFGTVESFEQSITEVIDNSALVITGTVEEGATLTADVSAIVYIGDSNVEPSAYQWYVRQDTGEEWTIPETNIVSNLQTFEIPDTQQLVGYYVKCEVTYIPDSSDTSKTVIFDADVGPVENVNDSAVDNNNDFDRYGYSGLINLGGTLFANTSFLSDEDELDTSGFIFRWYYTPEINDTDERILLESSNYTSPTDESSLQLSDDYLTDSSQTLVGKYIVLEVDTLDKFGGSQTFEYTATTEVRNGIPIIEGVVEEGTKVEVRKEYENNGGIKVINDRYWDEKKDLSGNNFKDYTYQWQLSDDGINNWTDLVQGSYDGTDPTSFQYLIPDDQEFVGKYLRARVTVFENSNYEFYTDAAQIENTEDEATGTITISGLYQVDQTLYATTNITDIDDYNLEYKYTWKRSVDKNIWISFHIESTPVSESTTSVVIPSDSAGEYIQLEVTTIDQYGGETVLTETINDTVKTGQASFLGIVMPEKILTAVTTEILYIGDNAGNSQYTYQWQISNGTINLDSDFVNIQNVINTGTNSTGQEDTYKLPETNDYKNRYVRVIVNYEYPTETNLYESKTSAQQIQVLASILCFTGDAIITTDQGDIPLQDLTYNHTVGKNRIKFICKTYYVERELVHIPKDALGPNYPNQDTYCSLDHKIQYKGKFYKAEELWDRVQALNLVPYSGELLYNVMLEHRNTMIINNMVTESLNKFYMRKFRRMGLYERQCLE